MMPNNILTITQLNYTVRHLLEMELGQVWLVGEISNLSKPVSGHWYLTLKDEQAQVRCAMFRMKNSRVTFPVQDGMQVLVRANVSLYEPRGDYQVIIESMQPVGDGLLQQQFEQLKLKLATAGLFSQEHKKTLPAYIKKVGIITSSSGAALQDILHILNRRDPSLNVVIYPTMVQGQSAAQEIADTITLANLRQECDVLIVGRGGGSLEDLWCFNEECVAYAIFHSHIPIISAVGHETDVTIADFVADLRAPTPSAAAELVSRDQQDLIRQLRQQQDRASYAFDRIWIEKVGIFERLRLRIEAQHPQKQLIQRQQRLTYLQHRMMQAFQHHLKQQTAHLTQLDKRLRGQHPQRQLQQKQSELIRYHQRLFNAFRQHWQIKQQCLQQLLQSLHTNALPHRIHAYQYQLTQIEQRMQFASQRQLYTQQQAFQTLCAKLEGLSPLKILGRGYSVTFLNDNPIISAQAVNIGEKITTRLHQGEIISQVIAVK